MTEWDLAGAVRRIRRRADMSQRQVAEACGVAASVVAKAEARTRDLPTQVVSRLAAVAGLRLALLDSATGDEVQPMTDDAVRDAGDRLFPAHLDTRHGDDDWWGTEHRPGTRQPRYTYDADRRLRDWRRRDATPDDHHAPTPGDSLTERAAARRQEKWRRVAEERERWFLQHAGQVSPDPFTCTCLPGCDEVAHPTTTWSTRRSARAGATWTDPLLRLVRARQPPAYQPRRGPLLGRPPRRGDRASPGAS